MKITMSSWPWLALSAALLTGACGGSDDEKGEYGTPVMNTPGDAQRPATGHQAMTEWLAGGAYKQWACEPAVHEAREPSPHGYNRICSNGVLSANASGTGVWPKGAAAVKEMYADQAGTTPVGYAVYLKTQADSADGANWYWYEIIPKSNTDIPHDANGVVADGLGSSGTAKSICVGCHAAAGSDAAHTPSPGGRDEVYTPVGG